MGTRRNYPSFNRPSTPSALAGSAVALPDDVDALARGEGKSSIHISLSVGRAARDAGMGVVDTARATMADGVTSKTVRLLARLVKHFPDIVLHLPEFHAFMDSLVKHGQSGAVGRIMGASRRGRPIADHFYVVGLVDCVMEQKGLRSVGRAARWMSDSLRLPVSARRIENIYCELKPLYELYQCGRYVPPGVLSWRRWGSELGESE